MTAGQVPDKHEQSSATTTSTTPQKPLRRTLVVRALLITVVVALSIGGYAIWRQHLARQNRLEGQRLVDEAVKTERRHAAEAAIAAAERSKREQEAKVREEQKKQEPRTRKEQKDPEKAGYDPEELGINVAEEEQIMLRDQVETDPSLFLEVVEAKMKDVAFWGMEMRLDSITIMNGSPFAVRNIQGEVEWWCEGGVVAGKTSFLTKGSIVSADSKSFSIDGGTLQSETIRTGCAQGHVHFSGLEFVEIHKDRLPIEPPLHK